MKSASIVDRVLRLGVWLAVLSIAFAAPARAEMQGHANVGYGRLFADGAPGGSLAMSAGFDWPLATDWRVGMDVGYSLLGSSNVNRGSLFANIDYSALSMYAVGIWQPADLGPLERITLGAGVMNGLAEIAAAGGGAAFRDLAREGIVPGALISATFMQRKLAPLRAGLQLDARMGFLDEETWVVATAGVAFHY